MIKSVLALSAGLALQQVGATVAGVEKACKRPTAHTGYTYNMKVVNGNNVPDITETYLDPCFFKVAGWKCDTANGYTGSAKSVGCTDGGDYGLTGCYATCNPPAQNHFGGVRGYTMINGGTEQDRRIHSFNVWDWRCNTGDGYSGVVTVSACPSANTAYTLSGCVPTKCLHPMTTGYVFTGATGVFTPTGFNVNVDSIICDINKGWVRTAAVTATVGSCTTTNVGSGTPYTVTGCQLLNCIRPTGAAVPNYYLNVPIGNLGAPAAESPAFATFSVTGITCQMGYHKAASNPATTVGITGTKCAAAGQPYSISGCILNKCKNNFANPTFYDLTGCDANTDIKARTVAECKVKCAAGYSNVGDSIGQPNTVNSLRPNTAVDVVVTCNTPGLVGTFGVTNPCTQKLNCNRPSTTGYRFTTVVETDLRFAGNTFQVTGVACASGWWAPTGVVTASKCAAVIQPYVVSGCEQMCTRPVNTAYNFNAVGFQEVNLRRSSFDVRNLKCASAATAYEVGPGIKATLCPAAGQPYVVAGCELYCKRPTDLRYDFSHIIGGVTTMSVKAGEHSLKRTAFSVAGLKCNRGCGYVADMSPWTISTNRPGFATVSACPSGGTDYVVSGCKAVACYTPKHHECDQFGNCAAVSPPGYDLSSVKETRLTPCNFDVTNAKCHGPAGYSGTAAATSCANGGHPYKVGGCTATHCSAKSYWGKRMDKTPYGYMNQVETNLKKDGFSITGGRCNWQQGASGAPTATCPTAGLPWEVSGCLAYTACRLNGVPTGYDVSGAVGTFTPTNFAVTGVTCKASLGYTGNAVATKTGLCTDTLARLGSGYFTVSGCAITRCRSRKAAGQKLVSNRWIVSGVTETTLTIAGFSVSGVTCNEAAGWHGVATATACPAHGNDYVLSGCTLTKCVQPATVGYNFANVKCSQGVNTYSCEPNHFVVTGLACAAGYHGMPRAAPCNTVGQPYIVHGCHADCTMPSGMDAIGFSFKQVQYKKHFMDLQRFAKTISCDWACGYTGVAHSHCTSSGQYKLSGTCQAGGCLQPSTTGYKFPMATGSCTKDSCDIAKTIQCDAAAGYWGTPTVKACAKAGEAYSVHGCHGCLTPKTPGYVLTGAGPCNPGQCDIAKDLKCDTAKGYTGTVTVKACSATGTEYTVEGCKGCTTPSTTGYLFSKVGPCAPKSCDVSVFCDSSKGYVGVPKVTACTETGKDFTVTGCAIPSPKEVVKYLGSNSTVAPKKVTSLSCPVMPSAMLTTVVAVLLRALA